MYCHYLHLQLRTNKDSGHSPLLLTPSAFLILVCRSPCSLMRLPQIPRGQTSLSPLCSRRLLHLPLVQAAFCSRCRCTRLGQPPLQVPGEQRPLLASASSTAPGLEPNGIGGVVTFPGHLASAQASHSLSREGEDSWLPLLSPLPAEVPPGRRGGSCFCGHRLSHSTRYGPLTTLRTHKDLKREA